jgi:hypothetical protein
LIPVTPKNIKRCGLKPGQAFYGLEGQGNYADGADRIKQVKKIRFGGYGGEYDDLDGDITLKFKPNYEPGDTIVIDGFGAYACDYSKKDIMTGTTYGTGSGCDVVYMFAAST